VDCCVFPLLNSQRSFVLRRAVFEPRHKSSVKIPAVDVFRHQECQHKRNQKGSEKSKSNTYNALALSRSYHTLLAIKDPPTKFAMT
jgi:hypothetical protein